MEPDVTLVRDHLADLQDRICAALAAEETGPARFREDARDDGRGGLARPRVLEGGAVLERAAAHFTHTRGREMPAAATTRRPELAGRAYEAVSVSVIVHPRNPYAPTSHANFRFFLAHGEAVEPVWWFGGGFDLTPYYGFEEDCVHWHRTARDACAPFGDDVYPRLKAWCDRYFVLPHRDEPRGVGGVFFDDLQEGGFERCFGLWRALSEAYVPAYVPLLRRRKGTAWGERERDFQLVRRGRYVEFNLLHDRGTRFGLQAGGPVESILASLPPEVRWRYRFEAEAGSRERELVERFLRPRDWAAG